MNSSFRIAVLANTVALIAASLYGKADHALGTEQTLSIHLYDQAQIPPRVLRLATEEAARLLRDAGVRTSGVFLFGNRNFWLQSVRPTGRGMQNTRQFRTESLRTQLWRAGTFGGTTEFFKAWGETNIDEARRIVDDCLDAGVNLFDTAEERNRVLLILIYASGRPERGSCRAALARSAGVRDWIKVGGNDTALRLFRAGTKDLRANRL